MIDNGAAQEAIRVRGSAQWCARVSKDACAVALLQGEGRLVSGRRLHLEHMGSRRREQGGAIPLVSTPVPMMHLTRSGASAHTGSGIRAASATTTTATATDGASAAATAAHHAVACRRRSGRGGDVTCHTNP